MKKKFIFIFSIALTVAFGINWVANSQQIEKLKAISNLSDESQSLIFETMERVKAENEDLKQEIENTRETIIEIFSADIFDEDKLFQEIDNMKELHSQLIDNISTEIVGVAGNLSVEERKSLSKIFPKGHHFKNQCE